MSHTTAALAAEARKQAGDVPPPDASGNAPMDADVMRNVAKLLIDFADALDAAQVPATDDEREALDTVLQSWNGGDLARHIIAAGWRRSSRVPVGRDELAAWLKLWLDDDMAHDASFELADKWDFYPKADRKPADPSNGDDRG